MSFDKRYSRCHWGSGCQPTDHDRPAAIVRGLQVVAGNERFDQQRRVSRDSGVAGNCPQRHQSRATTSSSHVVAGYHPMKGSCHRCTRINFLCGKSSLNPDWGHMARTTYFCRLMVVLWFKWVCSANGFHHSSFRAAVGAVPFQQIHKARGVLSRSAKMRIAGRECEGDVVFFCLSVGCV